ncbi:PREDICTED: uncharacterized protein LOC104787514 isoform X2 [Camelina sativa]|uniref:Uncharacterized protein LOC104787514 isoform X2 n=1 Tax=Camelina sativa TaxID=90675 RepID=A0ABM0Z799_CAMSA|nr:PREDICTED: uncharacterized protein LOC104787514 isoform X2 [Camelina sativa]
MSTRVRMPLLMVFLHLLFSATIHADQNVMPLKIFKISENVTYDCIDIYKQPGLDHPLLKDHTIQVHKLRSRDGPYRGVEGWISLHNLNIGRDQASYTQIYIGSGLNNQVNFIQAGWMLNPGLSGDSNHWSYGFWKGKDGKGCYNTACPGFVQISQEVPIAQPLDQPGEDLLYYSIHQDKRTGNWWITKLIPKVPNIDIGYWPKELFDLMDTGANMVGVGGAVQDSRQISSPPMGNGKFPNGGSRDSALFPDIKVVNSNYEQRRIDYFPLEKLLDSPKCYGLRIGKIKILGFFFNYGGPGGNSCGV